MTRALCALFLSLVLALSGHSMAVAKGSPVAVGQMVICTGLEMTVIYTDANGQPTHAPHLCPDCVMHVSFGLVPEDGAVVGLVTSAERLTRPRVRIGALTPLTLNFLARGPPGTI